jgi:hypothetical protein
MTVPKPQKVASITGRRGRDVLSATTLAQVVLTLTGMG